MSVRGAPHLPLPAAGCRGWECAGAGAGAGDAYVRVARSQAARAPRVTAGGDCCGLCATRRDTTCAVPSSPSTGSTPTRPLRGAREPAAAGASFWRWRLVPPPWWPALTSVLFLGGPIFQLEKLTLQALKCFAPASRGLELHYVRMGRPSCPHNTGCVKSIQGVSDFSLFQMSVPRLREAPKNSWVPLWFRCERNSEAPKMQ